MFKKFGQVYITVGYPNVIKAWHYHKIQTDNFICIKGNAKVVLCDNRKDSSTYKKINEFFIGEKNPVLLTIPNHVWHGFKAIGGKKAVILNCPTELYNYDNPDEYRLQFNSKEIDYDWEIKMG